MFAGCLSIVRNVATRRATAAAASPASLKRKREPTKAMRDIMAGSGATPLLPSSSSRRCDRLTAGPTPPTAIEEPPSHVVYTPL